MPKLESSNPNGGASSASTRARPNWTAAIVCLILGVLLAAAFLDYSPEQTGYFVTNPIEKNIVGSFGANIARIAFFSLGAIAWLIPVFLFWFFYLALKNSRRLDLTRLIAVLAALITGAVLTAMFDFPKNANWYPKGLGGFVGAQIYTGMLKDSIGDFGTVLLFGTGYALSLLFVFTKDIGTEIEKMLANFSGWREGRAKRRAALAEQRLQARPGKAKEETRVPLVLESVGPANKNVLVPKAATTSIPLPPEPKPSLAAKLAAAKAAAADKAAPSAAAGGKIELNIVKPEELKKARAAVPQAGDDKYTFPPLNLLKEQVRAPTRHSEEEHRANAENLLRILGEFGVEVTLGEIHVGPVITRYELVPAAGVRVEKISGLDKNIALGMRAQSVRILAPIPGKAAVGVEVPNQNPTPVGLREILESEDWVSAKAELPIALGKDVSGKPLISDLAKMPHLLIAGATGSGKSVCINSIVASILYSKSPSDVRLIMVDPKVVELKIFNSLPHMLIPVVTEPKKVPGALKWLLSEMAQRYQIFAKVNVRNITGFNQRKKSPPEPLPGGQTDFAGVDPLAGEEALVIPERLPYIIAIIDELADLMMVAPAEIETSIARLAQLARAAGIHLIIATQRPSVNVITGVIKANLPSRIAFQVASQVDSRTILDVKGADTLIGRGDMLFSPPGTSRLVRAQGAFVSDEEVIGLVEHLKEHNDPPVYAQAVQAQIDRAAREEDEEGEGGEGEDGDLGDDDTLYHEALEVLKSSRRASTSMLQRRLRIGYNRAARIMEIMEEKGVVGPENGSSPREILVDLDNI
jgi:DNA segregation ATPase FtsK/SpoIIIE, S-DNA-T family